MLRAALLSACLATPVAACDLALALAVDVSGSVDSREYATQMQGLATALRDSRIAEALLEAEAMVTLVQWSGDTRHRTTIPWTQMRSYADVLALAERVASDRRVWRNYSTAIGEALLHTAQSFDQVPECRRRIIDVSGDGPSNEGRAPHRLREFLTARGITVNALAIETDDVDLTGYFFENVIHGSGAFVVTAEGFDQYPARIRQKLLREITRQVSAWEGTR
ncbi:DUF1194 domain-containing protein [Pseudaestuariivita sp.]|uniref:DUF1194 domain-containing protein n=1 Tax=Pseudaestuariivita sp. TaxID=2211669 RepID=UPI00405A1EA9